MIDKNKFYAVIGVSADTTKFGYKVFADLLSAGFSVVPINPRGGEVLGRKVYPDLASLPEKPDWVVLVVPPVISGKILAQVIALGIKNVWFQPGSEDRKVVKFCQAQGLNYICQSCIMVERNKNAKKIAK